jgi:phage terminase small subunit
MTNAVKAMPVLQNVHHERYAQGVATGATQSAAYREAGFSPSTAGSAKANASRLRARPEVNGRVQELLDAGARRAEIKAADIVEMLLEDRERAHANSQAGPAVRATELLGKMLGMFVDRREVKTGLLSNALDEMSIDDLDRLRDTLLTLEAQASDNA